MDKINIDPAALAAFKEGRKQNGAAQSQESAQDSQNFDERATAALKGIDKSLKWLINTGDKKMKEAGGSGIGNDTFREDYHELWMVNIEEWAKELENDEILKKSPRVMLGIVTAGILASNGYEIYQKNKSQPAESQQSETKKEDN